jgi:hypothetical protein
LKVVGIHDDDAIYRIYFPQVINEISLPKVHGQLT